MTSVSRRNFLALASALPLAATSDALLPDDDKFLEDLSRRAFLYFWEQSDPHTGLVLDRCRASGEIITGRHLDVASIAASGFGLCALCIASARRWADPNEIHTRLRSSLRHLFYNQEHVRGWYYHFVDRKTGARVWNCELSTIDTAILIAGVLTVQQCYKEDPEIVWLAQRLFERVDFNWMVDHDDGFLRMGWFPNKGFLRAEWFKYVEGNILYLLAIASPTHPIPVKTWYLFDRQPIEFCGYNYYGRGPIFTHQYSQAWMYTAGFRDGPPFEIDYFQNSVTATYAHRAFCLSLRGIYPSYSENVWGITASDSEVGYVGWGNPLSRETMDGTVAPCAAGGSLMFAPEICLPALRYMHANFGEYSYDRYGFVDAFNPQSGWANPDVVGIDVGITLISAENLRSKSIWQWFNSSPDIQRATQHIFHSWKT